MNKYVTAKTFPLSEDGKFQSGPAEAAYTELMVQGGDLIRDEFRLVLQAYECAQDKSRMEYEKWAAERIGAVDE